MQPPRYRSHGGKSDASDAYLLADLLRTDGHRFAPLCAQSDDIRALRTSVRGRDDLVATRVQLPTICVAFSDPSGRAPPTSSLTSTCPSPWLSCDATPRLGPPPASAPGTWLVEQIRLAFSRIEHHIAATDDGRILMSFPRAGRLCAAQILAEIGSVRERFDSDNHLAAEAGVSPVTHESGRFRAVVFRWACNHRLRAALTCLADNSRHAGNWAAHIYAKARARGCDHPHALRILARAWVRHLARLGRPRTL